MKPFNAESDGDVVNSADFSFEEENLPLYFQPSRKKELQGVMKKRKALTVVKRHTVPEGERLFKTRFVDHVKKRNDGTYQLKSRLVGMNYNDVEAGTVATKAPTVKRMSHRMILCASALNRTTRRKKKIYSRDITQAFCQAKHRLSRRIYFEGVPEMGLQPDEVLMATKPLYGIPESPYLWFQTYSDFHITELGLRSSTVDPCFFLQRGYFGQWRVIRRS